MINLRAALLARGYLYIYIYRYIYLITYIEGWYHRKPTVLSVSKIYSKMTIFDLVDVPETAVVAVYEPKEQKL